MRIKKIILSCIGIVFTLGIIASNTGAIDIINDVYAHEHSYIKTVIEPTCETEGFDTYVCECGEGYKDNIRVPLGHKYSEWKVIKEPYKEENGIKERECQECGNRQEIDFECEHEIEEIIEDSTCVKTGLRIKKCSKCERVFSEEVIELKEHSFGDWVVLKAANPFEKGTQVRKCSCGKEEVKEYTFSMKGSNSIYMPTAGINARIVKGAFTQNMVDRNDIVYNDSLMGVMNPIVLGHNTGTLGKLHNIRVGDIFYLSVNGNIEKYKVKISEKAVEIDNQTDLKGLVTGAKLKRIYGTKHLHMYTCHWDKNLGKIRWLVIAEKI